LQNLIFLRFQVIAAYWSDYRLRQRFYPSLG